MKGETFFYNHVINIILDKQKQKIDTICETALYQLQVISTLKTDVVNTFLSTLTQNNNNNCSEIFLKLHHWKLIIYFFVISTGKIKVLK